MAFIGTKIKYWCFCCVILLNWAEAEAFANRITIGTFNVENLWDHIPDNTEQKWQKFLETLPTNDRNILRTSPQYEDYSLEQSNWYNREVLESKISHLLETIKLAGTPDILGLQEIESAQNNSEVWRIPFGQNSTLQKELEKLGYKYFLLGEQDFDNPVSVTTAVISKLPLKSLERISIKFSNYNTSARDIQVVSGKIGNSRLVIFNGHLKSKIGSDSEKYRIISAKAIKQRIQDEKEIDPDSRIIVLGDLNSAYGEKPLIAMGETENKEQMLENANDHLYNLWYELDPRNRWEHSWDGLKSTLSHLMLSDSLFNDQGLIYVDRSFRVIGHSGQAKKILLGPDGVPFRWQYRKYGKKTIHIGQGYSDHLPLVAEFDLVPYSDRQLAKRKDLFLPNYDEDIFTSDLLTESKLCTPNESVSYQNLKIDNPNELLDKCLIIDSVKPLKFKTIGIFKSNFITISVPDRDQQQNQSVQLVITMNRAYDWRPNADDSRVDWEDIDDISDEYGPNEASPKSNKCFIREVLQGDGGSLEHAVGRIGYANGYLSLFVASREENHLILKDLPAKKAKACPWNG